jgi:hypothetical protein
MCEVSETTKVPISTLYSWREKVRAYPNWRPSPKHFFSKANTFPLEVEAALADFIRLQFVSQGRALTRSTLRPLFLLLVQDLAAEGVLEFQAPDFKGSYHFMSNFLKKIGLGFRRAGAQRRPILDDEECAYFMANTTTAYRHDPPYLIINFNESN